MYATCVSCFYSCSNCDPVNIADAVTLQVECEDCQKVVWYIESTEDFTVSVLMVCLCFAHIFKYKCPTDSNIYLMQGLLRDCQSEEVQRPLIKQAEDVTSLTIDSEGLQKANHDIKVVVYGKNVFSPLVPPTTF